MASNKIVYRFVDMGRGGTFRVDEHGTAQEQIPLLGTTDCMSCTGVYLPIDTHRCFLAHINAQIKLEQGSKAAPGSAKEQEIEDEVLKRLQDHSTAEGWSARDVCIYVKTPGVVQKPVVACPDMKRGCVGYPVLQAIKRFLGPDMNVAEYQHPSKTGFVVNHATGALELFEFGNKSWMAHDMKFQKLDAANTPGEWVFDV
ncbi:hypothetical protein PRZ48_009137 [Zasmidium cellare]|uniref:Uncharacterized protein n=1 Tax=Zasmidium cellare TaxID=395010 RepID=A0ABR0EAY7_ZASCE|nr:hypothetical protein PRZ48_009137 [Zasmidium cellare]